MGACRGVAMARYSRGAWEGLSVYSPSYPRRSAVHPETPELQALALHTWWWTSHGGKSTSSWTSNFVLLCLKLLASMSTPCFWGAMASWPYLYRVTANSALWCGTCGTIPGSPQHCHLQALYAVVASYFFLARVGTKDQEPQYPSLQGHHSPEGLTLCFLQ